MLDSEKNAGMAKPYLGNRAVQWSRIDAEDVGSIKLTADDIQRYRLRRGDLLVCEGGEVGRAALWLDQLDECYFQKALHRLRSKGRFSSELLLHLLQHFSVSGQLRNFVTQTSIAHLPKEKFEQVPIPVPSTEAEQGAIAEALTDADSLVQSLEQLLAKKRQIKQGAMHELLTGQRRLPGFVGGWETKRFGDVVSLRRDRLDPRRTGAQEFCVEPRTGVLCGHGVTDESSSLKSVFCAGDVLFGKLRAYLRKHWLATQAGVCSTEIWVLVAKPATLRPAFLVQVVKTDRFVEAASSSYGTHMPRSDWNVVRSFEVNVPPLEEQTAIAQTLSDMDAELTALEARIAKARALKQGMAQALLTGRIRLV